MPPKEPPGENATADSAAAVHANLDPRPSVSSVHDAIDHNLITFDTYVVTIRYWSPSDTPYYWMHCNREGEEIGLLMGELMIVAWLVADW